MPISVGAEGDGFHRVEIIGTARRVAATAFRQLATVSMVRTEACLTLAHFFSRCAVDCDVRLVTILLYARTTAHA